MVRVEFEDIGRLREEKAALLAMARVVVGADVDLMAGLIGTRLGRRLRSSDVRTWESGQAYVPPSVLLATLEIINEELRCLEAICRRR